MRRKKDNDYRSSPHSLQSQSSSAHSVASSNGASASSSTNLYQADLDPDQNYDIILGLCKLVDDPSPMYSGPDPEEIKRIEEQRRKERLEVNNPFRITYNNGDFNSLLDVMKQHCDINVHFLAPNLFLESFGIYPLFAFFMLISLVYPDSMVKNIEKRIATIKTSNPPPQFPLGYSMPPVEVTSETVEIIDKFTGTRVFESPIITVFNELLKLDMIMNPPPDLSVPMISQLLNSILYNGDSSSIQGSSDGKTYHIITETKLKFDLVSNKIIEWTYTIVAVSTS